MKYQKSLIAVALCAIFVTSFTSCSSKDDDEPSEYEVYAPNAEGVHLTMSFRGDEPNIERTYLWISDKVVLWWSSNYNEWPKSVFIGERDYFKYYALSLKNVEPFIDCYKIVGGSDNHVIEDMMHPTKEAILDYINHNIYNYQFVASSPYYTGDVFLFNMTSSEYHDNLVNPNANIFNGDEDLD
ncbi:MAG: hypothetical protein K2K75_10380 [Muribaculaceae bacterium]|nr:hypothetical protein [Muribaculaceae bacterium]